MSLFILLLIILSQQSSYAQNFCFENVARINSHFDKELGYNRYLFGNANSQRYGQDQYVYPMGYSCNHIHFCKRDTNRWHSMASLYTQTNSVPQGDPRNPIFLFGEDLSQYLEFSFLLYRRSMHYFIPMPQKIASKVEILNFYLRQLGYEAIYYLPSMSKGVASNLETLKLGADLDGTGILKFPFSPGDNRLVTHEVSFHLLALLLPHAWVQRIININQLTLFLVQELDQMESFFGKKLTQYYKSQLTALRVNSMDTGAGNIFISYIRSARNNDFNNLESFGDHFNHQLGSFVGDELTLKSIKSLLDPEFTPFDSVLNTFLNIVNRNPPLTEKSVQGEMQDNSYEIFIEGLFEKYRDRFSGAQYQIGTELEFSMKYFSTFKERRRQISEAISIIELTESLK